MTDARTLTGALRGKWYRRYGQARCPAHGDRKPSLTLADGADGKLLLNCKAGCSFADVLDALRGLGLIEGRSAYSPPDPGEVAKRESEERAEAEKRANQAQACWKESQPVGGTVAEAYLRSRGITCDLPDTLRFHPDCWHPTAKRFPAMIAAIQGMERAAVHRTYLRPGGAGKADAEPVKAMLGGSAGGAVRLTVGPGPLVVTEGIETALSLASGLLSRPATIWACLSTSGMAALRLPDRPHRLTIASDGDKAGHEAAHKLATRAAALGWSVNMLPAPEGRDWNDILMMKGGAK